MFEKVNPSHPDKVADRIAGAIVDMAYKIKDNPKIAVEVLIGHKYCYIVLETNVPIEKEKIIRVVNRITNDKNKEFTIAINNNTQDILLSQNQENEIRCGDNGIFKGMPVTYEQQRLGILARELYEEYPFDGKFILNDSGSQLIICQSNANEEEIKAHLKEWVEEPDNVMINPLGYWTGGTDVDTGATNRKLGSDMGDAVTGGGLHGKDLSKADVSVNIYAHLKAQERKEPVELLCAIGDNMIDGKPYNEIVEIARKYITEKGGFEKFAEWGLI